MKADIKPKELKYSLLQLVMAKIKGYSSWPALIIGKYPSSKKPYYVTFIAHESFAYLQEHQMQPFDERCVAENMDVKKKGLCVALEYAVKIYRRELSIEQYLEQFPTLLCTINEPSYSNMAKETKQKITDLLTEYKMASVLEYTMEQTQTYNAQKFVDNAAIQNIMLLIDNKLDILLQYSKIKEVLFNNANTSLSIQYTPQCLFEMFSELKSKLPRQYEGLISKVDKLLSLFH